MSRVTVSLLLKIYMQQHWYIQVSGSTMDPMSLTPTLLRFFVGLGVFLPLLLAPDKVHIIKRPGLKVVRNIQLLALIFTFVEEAADE